MSLKAIIYDRLSNSAQVTDVLGSNIFPVIAPNGAKIPYLVYTLTGSSIINNKEKPTEVFLTPCQIDFYSRSKKEADEVGRVISYLLQGVRDDSLSNEVSVTDSSLTSISDDFATEQELARKIIEFEFFVINKGATNEN